MKYLPMARAVLSDIQFWVPMAVLAIGVTLLFLLR